MFAADEYAVNGPPVIVLTNSFWLREFGGNPAAVGATMQLDGTSHRVVGVLPEMSFMNPAGELDAVVPLRVSPGTGRMNRGAMWAEALARLRPGVTVEEARAELTAAALRIAKQNPAANEGISARLFPLRDAVVGSVGRMLLLLGLAVAAVLLTACVNVGNLLLAHASTRSREFAVRAALGGSTARIRRQVLSEALSLGFIGGALGLVLAPALTNALVTLYPGDLPRAAEVGINLRVVAAAVVATILAALLASVPTMRRASRADLIDGLRSGRGASGSRRARHVEGILISAQVAATLTLLFVATLMVRTFVTMTQVNPGFDPSNVIMFRLTPPTAKRAALYYGEVERSLRALPGAQSLAFMSHVPFGPSWFGDVFVREDRGDRGKDNPRASVTAASPGFDDVLKLRVINGRSFTIADDSAAPLVLMINESLAREAFPGENPVGKLVSWQGRDHWRIVGVVADAHDGSLIEAPPATLYAPYAQFPMRGRYVVMRSALRLEDMLPAIRRALRAIDPTVPMTLTSTIEDRIADSAAAHRFRAWLIASLGALACALALLGIYAIVSQAVTRQTREIGIRIALGQAAASVQRGIVARAFRVAAIGGVAGLGLSLVVGRSLSSFLYGVSGNDPAMLVGAAALLLACCALAAFVPAQRASRVDPVVALRAE
jgi:putative ABC transport system permease protein